MAITLNAPDGRLDPNFGIAVDQEATVQMVVQHLKVRYGESLLNPNYGIPVTQDIIDQDNEAVVVEIIRRAVLEVSGVISLTNIETIFHHSDRTLEMSFDLLTVYSESYEPVTVNLDLTGPGAITSPDTSSSATNEEA